MAVTEEAVRRILREELAVVLAEMEKRVAGRAAESDGRMLSVEEAAEYTGALPVETIRSLVKKKEIAHVKVARGVIAFKREQLDAYVAAHTISVEETPWGLTEGALRHIREGRVTRPSRID